MIKNKLTYVSLFSSAGVGCYGFKEEDFLCIATCELLEKRMNIQKINNKCSLNSGYILGDIKDKQIKLKIKKEIDHWKKEGNDELDVLIATPPCQGMSVANLKKNKNEINRNSLIIESILAIEEYKPKIFIFENVATFLKSGCVDVDGSVKNIEEAINLHLSEKYTIENRILNFKNYGSNSSRTRTLVIGINKKYKDVVTPLELFPSYEKEKPIREVLKGLKKLSWGEYDLSDFYHSFRTYDERMKPWISNTLEGQSAFNNEKDELKPHKVINGQIIINKEKTGDKYKRQIWNKVAPCIHTRNDQLASQNTIHPNEDRVFSIRELMKFMTIPNDFKWLELNDNELNSLSLEDKRKISKKNELNIRQSIGEAVPTAIFRKIAFNIKKYFLKENLKDNEIVNIANKYDLKNNDNLLNFIKENKNKYNLSSVIRVVELVNNKRTSNSAYYTNKFIAYNIISNLPTFENKKEITIVEPSVGAGIFLPLIFKKYEHIKKVNLIVIDIDQDILNILKIIFKDLVPNNFEIQFINADYLETKLPHADLIIGNPPFSKINSTSKNKHYDFEFYSSNLAEMFLFKALSNSDFVSLIMPKNFLNTCEFKTSREKLNKHNLINIKDFGELGFKNVLIETINLLIETNKLQNKNVIIESIPKKIVINQPFDYITDKKLPYWVIYRNNFFDNIFSNMKFDVFKVIRDRQISNKFLKKEKSKNRIRVLRSRNIDKNGKKIVNIENYDAYIDESIISKFNISKYLNNDNVYLVPNMTYYPRIIKKDKGCLVNGSIAILTPKYDFSLSEKQMNFISTDKFREFYWIARNYQTRSLNIDNLSSFWFGIYKED